VEEGAGGGNGNRLKSALAVPLGRATGSQGVLACYRRKADAFSGEDLRVLTSVAPRIGTAIENSRKVRELQERAHMDVVTGLPTKAALTQSLDVELVRAQKHGQCLAVVLIHFAGLDPVGGAALHRQDADRIAQSAAKALKQGCREYDTVARVADDTFVIIFPGMKAEPLGEKIDALEAGLSRELPRRNDHAPTHFRFGWALYPDDAATTKLLMAIAERRSEMQAGSATENLLALHAQNRKAVPPEQPEPSTLTPRKADQLKQSS
jgi:diguanylate cyclase (GGDEF)-like protein